MRLTVNDVRSFFVKYTEGAGVGDYSSRGTLGGWGREKYFVASSQTAPRPLSSFYAYARWQPVTQAPDLDDLSEK